MTLPPLPDPVAHNCDWRGDNDSCGWVEWYDASDPVPEKWEGTPPDEVTPVFTPDQMHAYARAAMAQAGTAPAAVVYPPDGTVSPFTVINLGAGAVQMGDSIHDHRLPALWFGKNGQGMGHEEVMNREAREGETLAVVTFSNVEGLDVLASVIERIRRVSFPAAAPAQAPAPDTLRDTLQRKCTDLGLYWRASDAHGIDCTVDQAADLLAQAIGVEVNIAQQAAPADPMDWPLPCDVKVGHGTMRKGVSLGTLVARMKVLYEMATGQNADKVAGRTIQEREALGAAMFNGLTEAETAATASVAGLTRQAAPATAPAASTSRCPHCDDTGDVSGLYGEWRGRCACPIGQAGAS